MVLKLADWRFCVDTDSTLEHTTRNASDHCECAYCKNFYEMLDQVYPRLCLFLRKFGINPAGPSELMPFEPTLMLARYRVYGKITEWGKEELFSEGVPIIPEAGENGSFWLWVGELELPWQQPEPMEEVVSPANLPEFLERMREVWLLRHGEEFIFS